MNRMGPLARKEEKEFFLFILPWLVGFLCFTAGPLVASIIISCTKWDILSPPVWIGIENYVTLFRDKLFYTALRNTAYYTVGSVGLGTAVALLLAVLLNQSLRGITYFRTFYYLPSVTSGIAMAILWAWIYNPEFGLLNYILSLIGIKGPRWLFDEKWAMPALILMSLWGTGTSMVIFLAALQDVPQQLCEAARLDGANAIQEFRHVVIPMISPVVFLVLVTSTIGSFQVFLQSYVMTNGGPGYATLTYVLYLYNNAFRWWKMGYASALAWMFFLIILGFTLAQFNLARYWVYYEAQRK